MIEKNKLSEGSTQENCTCQRKKMGRWVVVVVVMVMMMGGCVLGGEGFEGDPS